MEITNASLFLLICGLLPMFYVIFLTFRNGLSELASLRFCGVLIIWIGYHLTPWIAYLTKEPWESFLLVPHYVGAALFFSALAMVAFLVGYEFVRWRWSTRKPVKCGNFEQRHARVAVGVLSLVVFLLFFYRVGGFEQLWNDPTSRGEGQFDLRDWHGKLGQFGVLVRNNLALVLAFLSSRLILRGLLDGGVGKARDVLFGMGGCLVASLDGFYRFSRAAGIAFFIFAFVAMRRDGRKPVLMAILSVIFGIYLGLIGFFGRVIYNQGVGNFVGAAVHFDIDEFETYFNTALGPSMNVLSSIDSWTKKAETMEYEPHGSQWGLVFLWNLNPFPSEILPVIPLGTDLSDVMGTWGSVGLPTPAFAEIYFVFGYFGAVFVFLLGMVFGAFEKRSVEHPGIISSLYVVLCIASLGIGMHNSVRAMTRLLIYASVLLAIQSTANKVRRGS